MKKIACACGMLLVAACGQPDSTLQLGRWTGTVEFDTSALPKDMPILAPTSATIDRCLTPDEAQRPADFLVGGNASCDKSGVKVANGRIDGAIRCPTDLGGTSQVEGRYTSTSYDLTITTGDLKGHATASRVGDCREG